MSNTNNISLLTLIGNNKQISSDNLSVEDLIKTMSATETKIKYNIKDIIKQQQSNEEMKLKNYETMYNELINNIYENVKKNKNNMIYNVPIVCNISQYNYKEYTSFLYNKLHKNNILMVPLSKYFKNVNSNQFLISWRFVQFK